MSRLHWLAALMGITILGVTAFQLYWLKQSYDREKRSLAIKTELAFRETVVSLQSSKLKLDGVNWFRNGEVAIPGMKMFVTNKDMEESPERTELPKQEIVSSINIIRDKLRDSLKKDVKGKVIISMNNSTVTFNKDSVPFNRAVPPPPRGDYIFNLLYSVDSLQDSIRLEELDSAYSSALEKQKLKVPFSIERMEGKERHHEPVFNEVTIGFAKPVTYRLQLGSSVSYLLKQIAQPILFSILLLGITILSFVLLYRNLLKQRRLAELKNEFISNITHELKTPIATVGVAIEALKNFNAIDNPQRTREYLDISQNELQRLSLLVDKVLKLSMFEKQGIELKYETLDLREIVNEVSESLKLQLEKYRAQLTVAAEGDLIMQGDKLHLLSVVFNLLDNALKYSKENPVIQVELKGAEDSVILSVKDNGIGIPTAYKGKIFDKFFRVPHGDTHNAKGYGLGLSYVAQVVERHKGAIEVQGEPGEGANFIITLPKHIS